LSKQDIYLNAVGVLSAMGHGLQSLKQGLLSDQDFMTKSDAFGGTALPLGLCHEPLMAIEQTALYWQSRNNQFARMAYESIRAEAEAAVAQYGAGRVGVIVGTSTSGISDSEEAVQASVEGLVIPEAYHYSVQEMGNTAHFVADLVGATGPVYGISTACSSGAKALISAKRLISAGLCDVVIAGGVDTMCQLTVQGFSSLEAVSDTTCNPFSQNRKGINIGEAAALFVVSAKQAGVKLRGVGESSDAHHMSAPEPNGVGAEQCMVMALKDAGLQPEAIDYINLHGTATELNDQMEARAVSRIFGHDVLCSSTKPFTGHTLGAAGALEAAIAWAMLNDKAGFVPPHRWDGQADETIPSLNLVANSQTNKACRYVLSNSFAFGGNNVALILER